MKVSTALTLAASGAILAFAVHGHLAFMNLNAAGWVILLVGLAGLFMPPATQRWIRERLILLDGRLGPAAEARKARYSRLLMPGGILVDDGKDVPVAGSVVEEIVQR
jgi:hypothetical protein